MSISKVDSSLLRKTFGVKLEEPFADRSMVFAMLGSQNCKERCGAILLLREYWKLAIEVFTPLCMKIAVEDPSEEVQRFALNSLGFCHKNSFDRDVSRFVALQAVKELQPVSVRQSALRALHRINSEDQLPSLDEIRQNIDRSKANLRGDYFVSADDLKWAESFL